VVEVHGVYDYAPVGYDLLNGTGTAGEPIFIRGASADEKPLVTVKIIPSGSYLILENLEFGDADGDLSGGSTGRIVIDPGSDHIMVRHCDMHGNLSTGGIGVVGTVDKPIHDVVIYDNLIHDNGDWQADFDQDVHGIAAQAYLSNLWVVDNEMYHNSGDGIQMNAGSESRQASAHHFYIGRNVAYENKQTGFWTKQAVDVIVSQNVAFRHRPSGSSPGAGMGFQYATERIWFLFNEIYDCDYGIVVQSNSGLGFGTESFYIGNVIHDIHHSNDGTYNPATAWSQAAIRMAGGVNRYIIANTFYNVDAGFNSPSGGTNIIVNNIISNVTEPASNHIFLESGTAATNSEVRNNLFYQNGDPIRIRWASGAQRSLPDFEAAFPANGSDNVDADPLFVGPGSDDFHLLAGSPAIDAGAAPVPDVYTTFFNLYGIDIQIDADGAARPQGGVFDIGAYERQ